MSPNKRDVIKVEINETIEMIKIRYMMYSIRGALSMFLEKNNFISLSLSKFFNLRPKDVLLSSKMPKNVCVCTIHYNMK
jgi:hypothetical protein